MMVEIEHLICCLFKLGVLAMLRLKPWSAKGASYHPAFVGNWPTVHSYAFSLINPLDEFSIKAMKTWGQSKISSCYFCVWCKLRESGSMGSHVATLFVESFSADLLRAIKSYWNYLYCFG